MKRARLLTTALALLLPTTALAQTRALQDVERAYQNVDFTATHALAERALQAGVATHAQTLRLYVLLGISAAALGNSEEAKQDFVLALAVDPRLKLDKTLSPKMREPYLEAQGYWAAAPERLAISAKASQDRKQLVVSLVDPKSLVDRVELGVAPIGVLPRSKFVLESKPVTRLTLPAAFDGRGFEYTLRALDRFGNVLAEQGTDGEPELAPSLPLRIAGGAHVEPPRSYLWPALFGAGALGAAAAGVVFHIDREAAAHDWNSPECEHRGQTREDQCRSVDLHRQRSEHWAIGFYGASAVLLTGSLISLFSGSAKTDAADVGLLGCAIVGRGVSCDGRF